jgi:lipopolysaccharide export LptBFGC system permease protein LptF
VLTAFWAIFLLALLDLFDDVQQNKVKSSWPTTTRSFTPSIVHLLTPVAVLVAVLITFGVMARLQRDHGHEGGAQHLPHRLPALTLSALICFGMFEAAEYLLPTSTKNGKQVNVIKGKPPQSSNTNEHRWILGSDGRVYNFDYLQRGDALGNVPTSLYGLSIYDVDPATWQLRDRLYAARAVWNSVGYNLERGWRWTFLPRPTFHEFAEARTQYIEGPSYFAREERASETMSFGELRAHIGTLEAGVVTKLRVELHRKIATR